MGQTQASIFAIEHAKNAAQESLEVQKRNARNAEVVTKIALGVSMPHQIAFILGLAPLLFPTVGAVGHSAITWLESLTLIAGAVGIPIAVDYLILICIRTLAAVAASRTAKRTAFGVMIFPVAVSGSFNVLAPGPGLIRVLFGVAVVLIPMSQAVRVVSQNPDFRKIEAMELSITHEVGTTTTEDTSTEAPDTSKVRFSQRQARERAAYARRIYSGNAGLTPVQLAAAAGVSRNTAARIITAATDATIADMEADVVDGG